MADDKKNLIPVWMQRWLIHALKWIACSAIFALCTFLWGLDNSIDDLQANYKTLASKQETDKKQWERIGKLMEDVARLNSFHE